MASRAPWRPTVPRELAWIWACGAVLLLLRVVMDVGFAEGLPIGARRADARAQRLLDEVCRNIGLSRRVGLGVHPDLSVPAVVGSRRPIVLLPEDARDWPIDQLRSALRHELAHVTRHDYLVHTLSSLVLALYWPTPLAWLAREHLERERESACDERVIAWGTEPVTYAQHLVNVARAARGPRLGSAAALSGRRFGVSERVGAILDTKPRRRWSAMSWALGVGLTVGAVVSVASVSPVVTERESLRRSALDGMRDAESGGRGEAAWMLGALESKDDVGVLSEALSDDSQEVRVLTAWALGEIKHPAGLDALVAGLHDPDPLVREMAVLSIGELEGEDGVEPLIGVLESHPELRAPVRWALLQIGGPPLLAARGLSAGGERLPDIDLWAGGLAAAKGTAVRDLEGLVQALEQGSAQERADAAIQLGRLGDKRALPALFEALRQADPSIRAAAIWALDEITPDG